MTKHTRKLEEIFYKAYDGMEFKKKEDCSLHEWKLNANVLYVPMNKYSNRQGVAKGEPEIFSSKALAEKAIKIYSDPRQWEVVEVYIDMKFWKEDL